MLPAEAMAQIVAHVAPEQNDPGGTAAVTRIVVSGIENLPPPVRTAIGAQIAATSDDQLKQLRQSLSNVPAVKSALRAKGKEVRDVVAAAIGLNGVLILVTTIEV
jgi:hypothetical protein